MVVLVTCKNDENPVENVGARVFINFIHNFFRRTRADNSGIVVGIWPKVEPIQDLMHVLVTCKIEDDRIKNEGARVVTTFSPL